MKFNIKNIIALSIVPQYLLVTLIKKRPDLVETYYSNGLYPVVSKGLRIVFGWLPFSIGDLFYTIASILIIRFLIKRGKWFFYSTRKFFREVFVGVSILYFAFHFFWGMNYHREPLHKFFSIEDQYTNEELFEFTQAIINKSNTFHLKLAENECVKVDLPYTRNEIFDMTQNGFEHLSKQYPKLAYNPISIKKSIYSIPLTYMGYSGYINPFTNEAQVNSKMPIYKFPTTSCHEQAHQIGFAAENEANFIGYLAAIHNEDIYFKYVGYTYGLRYCLGEVYRRDKEMYEQLSASINEGVKENYREVTRFWDHYQNPAEPVFKKTFDTYLKANSQDKGIKSYSYVVALFVNYYKHHTL